MINGQGGVIPPMPNQTIDTFIRTLFDIDPRISVNIEINPSQYAGMPLSNGRITAPMYYAVQEFGDCVEITYVSLFAFQGGQTIRALRVGTEFWCILNDYGQHQGDLEEVTVRLRPRGGGDYEVDRLIYYAHGDASEFAQGDVRWDGSHPVVYSALNGHSMRNPFKEGGDGGGGGKYWVSEYRQAGVADFGSSMGEGIQWRPFETSELKLIGLDASGNPIGTERWAKFGGRLGKQKDTGFTGATYFDGRGLDSSDWSFIKMDAAIGGMLGIIPDQYKSGVGPEGPARRSYIRPGSGFRYSGSQSGWRWCRNCQSLFSGAGPSVCPAWSPWSVADAGSGLIFLACSGGVLGSRSDGSVYLTTNRDAWERWRIDPQTDGTVLVTSAQHGLHLGARPDGSIYTHVNTESWERWRPATSPPRAARTMRLTSAEHGRMLGVTQGSLALQPSAGAWSVEDAGSGLIFLTCSDGVLGSRSDGSVYLTTNRDAWERWRIELQADSAVFVTSAQHGLHLGARPDGSIYTHANTQSWERWWLTTDASVGRQLHLTSAAHGRQLSAMQQGLTLQQSAVSHDPTGSGDYLLYYGTSPYEGQSGWRRCRKCGVLFYGLATTRCPADGGAHEGGGESYSLCVGDEPDRLTADAALASDGKLKSRNKHYTMVVQGDGNLVVYGAGGDVLWAAGTGGKSVGTNHLVMQSDGNLVVYGPNGGVVWAAGTGGRSMGNNVLVLTDDGNLVVYGPNGGVVWATNATRQDRNGQSQWRWCHKCGSLRYAGDNNAGRCPAGGGHELSGSGNYVLPIQ
ncbi:hypothetical protein WMF28_20925 [Sorangium sp. So ce590]|uniref:hypothetical protein n=1 Tax=Sorangium sp. So ce590 TaxID=3133317 RepID=UPI003F5F7BA7